MDVTCKFCKREFEIEPAFAARPYECPGCRQFSDIIGLTSETLTEEKLAANDAVHQAALFKFRDHSVAFTSPEFANASGTLVQIGHHIFVATAAHAVPDRPNNKIGILARHDDPEKKPKVIKLGKHVGNIDVGLLELDPESFNGFKGIPLTLDSVVDMDCGDCEHLCWLYGTPGALNRRVKGEPLTTIVPPVCVVGKPIGTSFWGYIESEFATFVPRPEVHVLFHYSQNDKPARGSSEELKCLPPPPGMSGGGFWQTFRQTPEGGVWSPDQIGLFAILSGWALKAPGVMSSWDKFSDFVFGIQIIHWLNLIAAAYPDLRGEILDRYPRIRPSD